MRKIIDCHIHHLEDSQVQWARELGYYKICLMDHRPDVLAGALKRHPDFVIALGWLPMDQDSDRQLAAAKEFRALGCRGFKIICPKARYDDDGYYPLYELAQEYQMPLFFHTGWLDQRLVSSLYPTKRRPLVDWYDVFTLDRIALDFPRLKLVAYHMGNTRPADAAVLMKNHPNVFADTCTRLDEFTWMSIGGEQSGYPVLAKTVVGTDGMGTREGQKAMMDQLGQFLDMTGASPALQDRVYYKTALRILGMDEELKKHLHAGHASAQDVDIDLALAGKCRVKPVSDFVDVQGEPALHETLAYVGYDDTAIHATIVCRDANIGELAISAQGPVEDIWQDDSIEMFITPEDGKYRHIVINPIGRAFIQTGRSETAQLPLPVGHKIAKDAWAVQLSIPFTLLGEQPQPGARWRINICRNKISKPGQTITWMEIASTFHDPASFGYIDFE